MCNLTRNSTCISKLSHKSWFEFLDGSLCCFVARQLLLQIYALLSVKFPHPRLRLCNKNDKYEVCICVFRVSYFLNVKYSTRKQTWLRNRVRLDGADWNIEGSKISCICIFRVLWSMNSCWLIVLWHIELGNMKLVWVG